jgi:hypothetical protein
MGDLEEPYLLSSGDMNALFRGCIYLSSLNIAKIFKWTSHLPEFNTDLCLSLQLLNTKGYRLTKEMSSKLKLIKGLKVIR